VSKEPTRERIENIAENRSEKKRGISRARFCYFISAFDYFLFFQAIGNAAMAMSMSPIGLTASTGIIEQKPPSDSDDDVDEFVLVERHPLESMLDVDELGSNTSTPLLHVLAVTHMEVEPDAHVWRHPELSVTDADTTVSAERSHEPDLMMHPLVPELLPEQMEAMHPFESSVYPSVEGSKASYG
jgi:hypothetical protein